MYFTYDDDGDGYDDDKNTTTDEDRSSVNNNLEGRFIPLNYPMPYHLSNIQTAILKFNT